MSEPEVVTLLDEDGAERHFRLHDAFEVDGSSYYLVEGVEGPEQVLLLKESEAGLETVAGDEFDRLLEQLDEEPS